MAVKTVLMVCSVWFPCDLDLFLHRVAYRCCRCLYSTRYLTATYQRISLKSLDPRMHQRAKCKSAPFTVLMPVIYCQLLPPPREICNRHGLFVCLSVYLYVSNCGKTSERICMKFSGTVGNEPMNKWLYFGGDPNHRYGSGYGSLSRHW